MNRVAGPFVEVVLCQKPGAAADRQHASGQFDRRRAQRGGTAAGDEQFPAGDPDRPAAQRRSAFGQLQHTLVNLPGGGGCAADRVRVQ